MIQRFSSQYLTLFVHLESQTGFYISSVVRQCTNLTIFIYVAFLMTSLVLAITCAALCSFYDIQYIKQKSPSRFDEILVLSRCHCRYLDGQYSVHYLQELLALSQYEPWLHHKPLVLPAHFFLRRLMLMASGFLPSLGKHSQVLRQYVYPCPNRLLFG